MKALRPYLVVQIDGCILFGFQHNPIVEHLCTGGLLSLLPLHLPLDNRELLGFAVLLGILLWLSRSWMQLLLWLGLQLFLLRYLRPPATAIKGKPSALMGNASAVGSLSGQWQISVLRAEIVTDEPWSGRLPPGRLLWEICVPLVSCGCFSA